MPTGTVKGIEIGRNRDGDRLVLLLQTEISDPDDLQTVELFRQSGEDYKPPIDSIVFVTQSGEAFKIAVACNDGSEPSAELLPGEREIYAIDEFGGERKSTARFLRDGRIVLQGGGDNAVRFSELKAGFDQLKTDVNALVNKYNLHSHPTAPTGPVSPPSVMGSTSSATIDPSKVDDLEVG